MSEENQKTAATETAKPWGKEVLLTPEGLPYVAKLMHINAGARLSLQYHDEKQETQCLVSGRAILWLGREGEELRRIEMAAGVGYTISPGDRHRLEGLEDAVVFEASTPEVGTTFRLEDDYGRPDETEDLRKQDNRGWTGD